MSRDLEADPHRPRYHFLPPGGWMNDPNGLIHWKGRYHLFYQHNPLEARWGSIQWGHAVSDDLVHWEHLPIALAPTPGGPDALGCWSGCAVDAGGVPALLYTGASTGFGPHEQRPCLARGSDDLVTFEKHPANPVVTTTPEGLDLVGFRDPAVWRQHDGWYQLMGSGLRGRGGAVLLYRSADLVHWEHLGVLHAGDRDDRDGVWTGEMWECPGFFPLGDRWVLTLSVCAEDPVTFYYPAYVTGSYDGGRFTPERRGLLDLGGHTDVPSLPAGHPRRLAAVGMLGGLLYAPQVFPDDRGRRLTVGWVMEARDEAAQVEAGWAGVLSLPRVLTLRPDGTVGVEPAQELARLRLPGRRWTGLTAGPATGTASPGGGTAALAAGDTLEIHARIRPRGAHTVGLVVRRSPDGAEQTRVVVDVVRGRLEVDRSRSSTPAEPHACDTRGGPLHVAEGEVVDLRVFLDRSVVEVFAAGGTALTTRIYPRRPDSLGIGVLAEGGPAEVESLEIWPLRGIW